MNIELNNAEVLDVVMGLEALKREILREVREGQIDEGCARIRVDAIIALRNRVRDL